MNLRSICIRFNAVFCLGSAVVLFWSYNTHTILSTTLGLTCMPVCLAASFGWHCASTGRFLRMALFLALALIPFAIWIYISLDLVFLCYPAILGIGNTCLLPFLKKNIGNTS